VPLPPGDPPVSAPGDRPDPGREHFLWTERAPGAEDAEQTEEIIDVAGEGRVRNVVVPTLTLVAPAPADRTGAGVVIAPGGGFHMLSWTSEGLGLARWFADRGVTALVLKYRLADTGRTREEFERAFMTMWASLLSPPPAGAPPSLVPGIDGDVVERAVADGRRSVRLLRERAEDFGVDPGRIAMVGFSAGAVVTVQAAVSGAPEERPDLGVVIYGGALQLPVPDDAPPALFIGAGDDPLSPMLLGVHAAWRAAGRPAELHLYEQGGHGFGLAVRGLPVDSWPEVMWTWLRTHGFPG
jgi:acetyl esterase/lipase